MSLLSANLYESPLEEIQELREIIQTEKEINQTYKQLVSAQDEKIKNLETNEKVREELIVELQKEIESQKSLCNHMEKLNKKNYEEKIKLKNGIIDEHARAERCKDKVLDLANISKGLQKDVKKLKEKNEEMINVNNKFKELLHKETSLDDMFIDELMDKANGE